MPPVYAYGREDERYLPYNFQSSKKYLKKTDIVKDLMTYILFKL